MKDKLIYILLIVITLLVGCQENLEYGGETDIYLTITPESVVSLQQRSAQSIDYKNKYISDGTDIDLLIYEVYDAAGVLLEGLGRGYVGFSQEPGTPAPLGQTIIKVNQFPLEIPLTLIRNQSYTIVCWAQSSKCKAFNTESLQAVNINYDGLLCNYEDFDAFCRSEVIKVDQNCSKSITLKRPFAQINLGVTEEDYNAAANTGMQVTKSKITISEVATELNVKTNEINRNTIEKNVVFEYDLIPAYTNISDRNESINDEKPFLYFDADGDGVKERYKYLMMCYILPVDATNNEQSQTAVINNVLITLCSDEGKEYPINDANGNSGISCVPVQRNWRTNIMGEMLTSDIAVNLKLVVDPMFAGDFIDMNSYCKIVDGVYYDIYGDLYYDKYLMQKYQNYYYKRNTFYITNARGLKWLSDLTNGMYVTFEEYRNAYPEGYDNANGYDNNPSKYTNFLDIFFASLDANGRVVFDKDNIIVLQSGWKWPSDGIFDFSRFNIVISNDIDWNEMPDNEYFIPIGSNRPLTLANPIDYNYGNPINPHPNSGKICGSIDGDNHTIKNLRIKALDGKPTGLIGNIDCGGRNISILNLRMYNTSVVGTADGAAAIVGQTTGSGTLSIFGCYIDNSSIVTTGSYAGGIIGQASTTTNINDCDIRFTDISAIGNAGAILGGDDSNGNTTITNCVITDVTINGSQSDKIRGDH